ncbi:DUF1934 domain-containing protein [Streptococcus cameli]
MQIYLKNEIQLDGEMEVIEQQFPVEVTEKNGAFFLVYTNDEKEKVMMKSTATELHMTRFSNPKTIMRFIKEEEAIITLPTPMGIQHFVTATSHYQQDLLQQQIVLHYDLKQLEGEGIFASYKMTISWM